MAAKRKSEHEEVETMKRLREEQETIATTVDRLTNLPEPLLLHILSSLETKVAIQTILTLWKSPVSSWTCIPVLNFNSRSFHKLRAFNKFVDNVLCNRGSAKLEKLTFKRGGTCSAKILRKVLCYAFLNGVKELEVDISHGRKDLEWPMSSDSLTSFKFGSSGCYLYGTRPGPFKNLTSLHLKNVIIEDLDPFSGYPALEKLTLEDCPLINTNGNVLNVHALHLSELTISNKYKCPSRCELRTPKLRYFEYRGNSFPQLTGDLPIAVVEYKGFCGRKNEKKMFDSLTSFKLGSSGGFLYGPRLGSFKNLTSLHLKNVIIKDLDPFSGYPALEKLTLVHCPLKINGNILNIHALHLLELTILNNHRCVIRCELTTPKLRYFEYRGNSFPRFTGDLPILDTAVVEYNDYCDRDDEKKMFDDVLMLFDKLCHAKSLTVFSSIVHLLSFFPDELVKRRSPFRDLKCLKLDFSLFNDRNLFRGRITSSSWDESMKHLPSVKAYLLQNTHDARCTMIYPSYM